MANLFQESDDRTKLMDCLISGGTLLKQPPLQPVPSQFMSYEGNLRKSCVLRCRPIELGGKEKKTGNKPNLQYRRPGVATKEV